ncbi:MAG: hypothetical protein J6Y02_07395 [Pseudobutyrivibrio sp.]|nr:hypothetical protein [Pseudobutyrivibrio sp.]
MATNDIALTTYNNPYDPFTDSDNWYMFDLHNGTDCCGYLSRIVDEIKLKDTKINKTNDAFVDDETNDVYIEEAMNKIVKINPLTYLIVHPNDKRYSLSSKEFSKTIPKIDTINSDD